MHILRLAESYHQLKIVSQFPFSSHVGLPNLPYLLSLQMNRDWVEKGLQEGESIMGDQLTGSTGK